MKMLGESSLPSSNEVDLSFESDHGDKELSYDERLKGGHQRAVPVMGRNNSCPSTNFVSSSSQQSTIATMHDNSIPSFVYQRRKQRKVSAAVFPAQVSTIAKPNQNGFSVISSESPSVVAREHVEFESRPIRAHVVLPVECSGRAPISKSASGSGCSLGEEVGSVEDPKHDMGRTVDVCCINDSCSSSKSNMILYAPALKTEAEEAGECSSSEAFMDGLHDDILEKDARISILRCLGLYKRVLPIKRSDSHDSPGINSGSSCLRVCKVCDQLETSVKMLICDQCEEAFHVSCCNPRVRKIPVDEWLCHSCFRKKHKITESTTRELLNGGTEVGRGRNGTSKGALRPIAAMLKNIAPYTSNVRIGPEFQAEVPVWSGSVSSDEENYFGEPLEMVSAQAGGYQDSMKPPRPKSISNWLQCQQVIEGVGGGIDGTVCGKWRRAPLFEVQTDDWECFCSALWDPTHADCAVPQEVDTDQVLKDLNFIETLRSRLAAAAEKQKLGCSKNVDPEGPVENVTNKGTI